MKDLFLFIFLLPLCFVIFDKKYKFSPKNISIILIVFFYSMVGIILFPFSYKIDRFSVENKIIFDISLKETVILVWLTCFIFLLTIYFLEKLFNIFNNSFNLMIDKFVQSITYPIKLNFNLTTLSLLSILGIVLILFTFFRTKNIPYLELSDAKYFPYSFGAYLPLRPFYVFALHLLSFINFILLTYILQKSLYHLKVYTAYLLLIINFFFLILTLKRGEIFFPFVMVLGGIILMAKFKRRYVITLIIMAFFLLSISSLLRPGFEQRLFYKPLYLIFLKMGYISARQPSLVQPSVVQPSVAQIYLIDYIKKMAIFIKMTISDIFGAHIRESVRVIYCFKLRSLTLLKGKTYIASFLGFLPTKYFKFKKKYQLGRYSAKLVGLNPEVAGGARIGGWTEAFLNFGLLGVILFGFFLGFFIYMINKFYILNFKNISIIKSIFCFFVLAHFVFGFFIDGSPALQTFILRIFILGFIYVMNDLSKII